MSGASAPVPPAAEEVPAPTPAAAHAPRPASASHKVFHSQPHSKFALCPNSRVLQAAAAARIVGKDDIIEAAKKGNFDLVKDHVWADAGCVLQADSLYVCPFRARAAAAHDV
jgi:hypothetical protein